MTTTEIAQLVLRERQSRVRRLAEQLQDCFHSDATVTTSWMQGSAADFVSGARGRDEARDEAGLSIVNRVGPPVVYQDGGRAVVELPSTTTRWIPVGGVEAELRSFMRLIYRVEERDHEWKISSLTAVNEADTLCAAVPGTTLDIDPGQLAQFRKSYRFLGYTRWLDGETVPDSLYGTDRPDAVDALYEESFTWLHAVGDVDD